MKHLLFALMMMTSASLAATRTDNTIASYHGSADRAGHYIVPGLTWRSAGTVRRDQAFDGRVDGHIYTQPLYWQPPDARHALIIVATESDFVYALDATTGRVVWRTALGRPVPLSTLPCGNIDPVGITATPVIDAAHGAVYLDAMVDEAGAPHHRVYGLRLTDGAVLPGWPVDVASALAERRIRFDPATQGQRGALALLNGRIFVPFGGNFGDCGRYHGVVVGLDVGRPGVVAVWRTRADKGGIWAPAGLSEADGSLYFTTGNTEGARQWGDGEGVFRVGPDLAHSTDPRDFFAPANWRQLDEDDLDLSGFTPLPLTLPDSPVPLLIALGKDGDAYLLDRADLGGIGHPRAMYRAARSQIITAAADYAVGAHVMIAYQAARAACPDGDYVSGIGALAVKAANGNGLHSGWCARLDGRGAPIVTTTDAGGDPIVWAVGTQGDDRLHGFRGDTGQEIYQGGGDQDGMSGLRHFATILAAAGRFYVAGDNRVFAFDLPR